MTDITDPGVVREWNGTSTGTTSVTATGVQDVDGLIYGTRWNTVNISFSFPSSASQYGSYSHLSGGVTVDETTSFTAVNAAMKTTARWVLGNTAGAATFGNVSLLVITENTASPGSATLRIGMSDEAQPTAYAYYPTSYFVGGDVWMGTQTASSVMTNPVRGNYAWHSMMHELGHALGLKHGQETGGPANTAMTAVHDSMEYSIMTYRSYQGASTSGGYTNEQYGYAQSLMMYDIAAIQAMYGARFDSTPHTYRFSATTGEMFVDGVGAGAPGANRVFLTIWDGSGNGTYDFSAYTTGTSVDLRPGQFSLLSAVQRAYLGDGHYAQGNVYNALQYNGDTRSLIRTVYCGSGSDTIVGNAANNTIYGGGGIDTIDGGAGWDRSVFAGIASTAATWVQNANGSWTVTAGSWRQTLTNVEVIQFTDKTVALRERPKADFDGNNCSDILWRNTSSGAVLQSAMNGTQVLSSTFIGGDLNWTIAGLGDFNGDGTADILWRQSSGAVLQTLMSGTRVMSSAVLSVNSTYSVAGTGDFNADGKTDILWRYNSTGAVFESQMNGSQTTATFGIGGDLSWTVAATGDFNGDGTSDILWRHTNGAILETLMNGGQVLSGTVLNANSNYTIAGTGDFNGDGKTDILWRYSNGAVYMSQMNGSQTIGTAYVGGDSSWTVAGTGDYNGDGRADILWRSTSGTSLLSLMNGFAATSTTAIGGSSTWTPITA